MCNSYYALYVLKTQYGNVYNLDEHILCIMLFAKSAHYVYNGVMKGGEVNMGTFGQRLRELRNQRGISQNELSKHIGVSKSSVNMYERDEREPGFETLEAIADFFNVNMDYLLGRESRKNISIDTSEVDNIISRFDARQLSDSSKPILSKMFAILGSSSSPDFEDNLVLIYEEIQATGTLSDVLSDMKYITTFLEELNTALTALDKQIDLANQSEQVNHGDPEVPPPF